MATLPNPLPQLASLGLPLPPGRLIDVTAEGKWPEPLLWLADETATPNTWAALQEAPRTHGLLPVLVDVGQGHGAPEDWELMPGEMSYPGDHDPEEILADFWDECCAEEAGDWPGLAATPDLAAKPTDVVHDLLAPGSPLKDPRLALVPARRSADIPTAIGWMGAANYANDTARLSAVLRSWEDRFGIRLLALGFDHLLMSVATPPSTYGEANAIAAEHFAFCPDNIWQGCPSDPTLVGYAEREVLNQPTWHFWWD
ncbi:DUF4253 domain-containing protein [Streptomyces sp. NPDC046909]|uniref:DUF4253 domain-containing protein n=1 Tax=Streptomyces sp. NPDC046909 TaxID=3155617 RepID=UPI0033C22774